MPACSSFFPHAAEHLHGIQPWKADALASAANHAGITDGGSAYTLDCSDGQPSLKSLIATQTKSDGGLALLSLLAVACGLRAARRRA